MKHNNLSVIESLISLSGDPLKKKNLFNSKHHLLSVISCYTGYSRNKVLPIFDQLEKAGSFEIENCGVKINYDKIPQPRERENFQRVPSYILLTHSLPDRSLWLNDNDYRILIFIDVNRKILRNTLFTEDQKEGLGFEESCFQCAKTIAEGIGISVHQVRRSLHKMKFYFGDLFYRKPTKKERKKRKYPKSHSYTIGLPERKDWKKIIEYEVYEINPNAVNRHKLPLLVSADRKIVLDEINARREEKGLNKISYVGFSEKYRTDEAFRKEIREKSLEIVRKQKQDFTIYVHDLEKPGKELAEYVDLVCLLEEGVESWTFPLWLYAPMNHLLKEIREDCEKLQLLTCRVNGDVNELVKIAEEWKEETFSFEKLYRINLN